MAANLFKFPCFSTESSLLQSLKMCQLWDPREIHLSTPLCILIYLNTLNYICIKTYHVFALNPDEVFGSASWDRTAISDHPIIQNLESMQHLILWHHWEKCSRSRFSLLQDYKHNTWTSMGLASIPLWNNVHHCFMVVKMSNKTELLLTSHNLPYDTLKEKIPGPPLQTHGLKDCKVQAGV